VEIVVFAGMAQVLVEPVDLLEALTPYEHGRRVDQVPMIICEKISPAYTERRVRARAGARNRGSGHDREKSCSNVNHW